MKKSRTKILENTLKLFEMQFPNTSKIIKADLSSIENVYELYLEILNSYITHLCSMGLYKEYIDVKDVEMTSPRGRINIQKSIVKQSLTRGKLVCSYQELTSNNKMNQIIKAVINFLIDSSTVREEKKTKLKVTLSKFNDVDSVELSKLDLKRIKYNNMTIKYKPIIFIANEIDNEVRLSKYIEYNDEIKIYNIYKSQVYRRMIDKHSNDNINVDGLHIEVNDEISSSIDKYSKKAGEIVGIRGIKYGVLIETRIYDDEVKTKPIIRRRQAEELAKHVVEYNSEYGIKAVGIITYINARENYNLIMDKQVSACKGIQVISEFIDLNDNITIGENKIDNILKQTMYRLENK